MKIRISDVRLSFPALFEPDEYKGKLSYRAKFLIEPGSATDKAIRAAILETAKDKFAKKAESRLAEFALSKQQYPYLDGNRCEFDGAEGMWVLTATRKEMAGRPLVIDRNKSPLTPADGKPYSGCYVNASVEFWAQDGENPGIRCQLQGVQFLRDGDAFGGGAVASPDDFDEITDGADAESLV